MSKTTAEKIAVMQAFERGENIEFMFKDTPDSWQTFKEVIPVWNWEDVDYRIAPKPKKTVELYQYLVENNGRVYVSNLMNQPPSSGKVLKRIDNWKMVVEVEYGDWEIQEDHEDGWITWNGGACPVNDNIPVDIKLRDGMVSDDALSAGSYYWEHYNDSCDIIAYRVVK